MSRPAIQVGCSTEGCNRPHHSGGFCNPCYKREKRGFRSTNHKDVTPSPKTGNAAPGRDPASQTGRYVRESGGVRRPLDGAFQMYGVVCPDCRHVIDQAFWCESDQHPIFDSTGRLIQMTKRSA